MLEFMKRRQIKIARSGSFEMAHRLRSAYTAVCCDTIHGHSYNWTVELSGMLREDGMLVDYGQLKNVMKLCEELLDHALWLPTVSELITYAHGNKKLLCLNGVSPTAECMAVILAKTVFVILYKQFQNIEMVTITIKETANSSCSFTLRKKDMGHDDFAAIPNLFDCRVDTSAANPLPTMSVRVAP